MSIIKKAQWIWASEEDNINQYVDFTHVFEIKNVFDDALIQISVDTNYVLWINGEFVDCGQFSDFPEEKVYDEIAISKFLKIGKNRLYIGVHYMGESNLCYKKGSAGLIYAIKNGESEILSSADTLCKINEAYKSGIIHKTTNQLGFGFGFDARKVNEEWKNSIIKEINTNLIPRPIKKLELKNLEDRNIIAQGCCRRKCNTGTTAEKMYSDYMGHVPFDKIFDGDKSFPVQFKGEKNPDEGIYIIVDLKEESCGFLTMNLATDEDAVVEIGYGEHMEDLRVRSAVGGRNFANEYIAKEGEQEFTYYFKRIACRYIQVHIWNFKNLKINNIGLISAEYPIKKQKDVRIKDCLHRRIYETCIKTLKLCMHEHYEDCPWREQALYGSDSRNAALSAYYAFGDEAYEFSRASLDLLLTDVKENGYFNICAPAREGTYIPSFALITIMSLKEYTSVSGDLSLAQKHWDKIKNIVDVICKNSNDGIMLPPTDKQAWIFYEWTDEWFNFERKIKDKPFIDGLHHIFSYITIKSAVELAKMMKHNDFADKYERVLYDMKENYNKIFWNVEKGIYASHVLNGEGIRYDELSQSLAVISGIADNKNTSQILSALADENSGLVNISLGYSIYKYEALLFEKDKYSEWVLDNIADKWGKMLLSGATSFWETVNGAEDFEEAGSLCHAWSATPIIVYYKLY